MAWSATCFLAQMFSQQTAQLLVYSGIKCYSVGRGLASQLLSRSVLKSSRIDSFKNGLVFLMILARNRFKGCLKRPEGQIYFCFPWIWRVSSEASQFLTLKMFVYFFFFPGRQRREGVKRNASRQLCKLFTLLDFLQQDMGCICGGESPKCLNRRWLPDKLRFGSSLYKSREETSPLFIPPFKQLYKILQACSNTPKFTGPCGQVWTDTYEHLLTALCL